jgi:hypothetical protein
MPKRNGKVVAVEVGLALELDQRCQIFHDAIYQNGEKHNKLPLNYQKAIKYTK